MAYEAKHRKMYKQSAEVINQALSGVIEGLGGKEAKKKCARQGPLRCQL